MFVLGGSLKLRERLSARLGDILSMLYIASAVLKRYEDEGRRPEDLPLMRWGVHECCSRVEEALYGLFNNMPSKVLAWAIRLLIFPYVFFYGREFPPPTDGLGREAVALMLVPGASRERLTAGAFVPKDESDPIAVLEAALRAVVAAEPVEAKLR